MKIQQNILINRITTNTILVVVDSVSGNTVDMTDLIIPENTERIIIVLQSANNNILNVNIPFVDFGVKILILGQIQMSNGFECNIGSLTAPYSGSTTTAMLIHAVDNGFTEVWTATNNIILYNDDTTA